MAVVLATVGAALYQLVLTIKLVGPTFREAAETVRVGVLGSALFGLAAMAVKPAPSPLFLALMSLAVLIYLILLVRLLQSHVCPFGSLTWTRSLRETLTF